MDRATRKSIEATGACTPADADVMTTEKPEYEAKAKSICSTCPVRQECLEEYFWETGVVIGGTSYKERRRRMSNLDIPGVSRDRLVDSYARGGLRALMIECCMDEDQAMHAAKLLRSMGAVDGSSR